jgi:hypothetical protein
MIIQLDGPSAANVQAASRTLQEITRSWGHPANEAPVTAAQATGDDKLIDPVSLAALILSIPSTALAVMDLTDRIRKRKRATELIDHARQLASQQVTATLVTQRHATDLTTLTPDQLLDLLADDETPG